MNIRKDFIVLATTLTLFVGCAGGGGGDDAGPGVGPSSYSGNTSAATVSDSNRTTAAKSAAIGAEKAIEIEIGSDSTPFSASREATRALNINLRSLSPRETYTYTDDDLCSSGSANYTYNFSDEYTPETVYAVYNNCTFSDSYTYYYDSITYDGTIYYELENDGGFYYTYDLDITYGGETYSLTSTMYCDSDYNCSYEENFSSGGISYRVSDVEVSYSSYYGSYDLEATVYHEDLGYITIEAEDLITCSGGGFQSGSIEVTDSTGTVVLYVDFTSCSSMTVTYNGVSTTVDQ